MGRVSPEILKNCDFVSRQAKFKVCWDALTGLAVQVRKACPVRRRLAR
jgi:hypothetical protein